MGSFRHAIRGHALFARRLAINFAIGLSLILASLFVGMLGYRQFEGLRWLDSFGHAAMILGGMGPYVEPKSDGGKLFGVTGLILAPIIHHVMHLYHPPDTDAGSTGSPKRKRRSGSAKRGST